MPRQRKHGTLHRRAVLQTLVVGLGAASLGRAIFACDNTVKDAPPRTSPTRPTDDDEYVPGERPPANGGNDTPILPKADWEARVKQLESEQARLFRAEVFTLASPGVMAGKERSHLPAATVTTEQGKKRVNVVVQHVMGNNGLDAGTSDAGVDAAKDAATPDASAADADAGILDAGAEGGASEAGALPIHYITTIYLRAVFGGKDTVVALWEFSSEDNAPPTVNFPVPPGVTSVTAYEWCTLHGLWAGSPIPI